MKFCKILFRKKWEKVGFARDSVTFFKFAAQKSQRIRAKSNFLSKVLSFSALFFFEFAAVLQCLDLKKPSKNLKTVNLQLYLGL